MDARDMKKTKQIPEILPHDPSAEGAVLAAILINNDIMPKMMDTLKASDFYSSKNAHIFSAMCILHIEGKPIDVVMLSAYLSERNLLDKVGGTEYLVTTNNEISTSAGALYHAEMVSKLSRKRQLITALRNAKQRADDGASDVDDLISDLQAEITSIGSGYDRKTLRPFTIEHTSIADFIENEPSEIEYVLEGILPKGIVGGIIGPGGVSKTFFEMILLSGLSVGQVVLNHFKPARPFRVLGLFAEDPDTEVHRRMHSILQRLFPEMESIIKELLLQNLHVRSVMGCIGPLMQFDNSGNPVRSEYYRWLRETIEQHKGLEVLVLDPKSRFYGLDENNNDHNTAWVACLEELAKDYELTVLFSHHVSKQSRGALSQNSARGGSALVDSCRWVANLRTMDEKTAEKFEIEDFKSFVEFDVSKSNYAPRLPATIYFKRAEHGVLVPVNLSNQRFNAMAEHLCSLLKENENSLSRRELISQKPGELVREQMKERFGRRYNRSDLTNTVDFALKVGMLSEFALSSSTRGKAILSVERMPE
ncbi:MAG: hypothetical protein C4576_19815 [Desulfobacteraceae bacterium]|nr:MAG: hypothetical protein C4576_19815 [Desulfobacteraceae bacterium]